jgi:SAM-dependent methyltransferase/uncharacterized protein YbaR (Trm112 family)
MNYQDFACPECRNLPLAKGQSYLECQPCQVQFPLKDGVPYLFPVRQLAATVDGRSVSLDDLRQTYDTVYKHDGLMGTDLDGHYDKMTKSQLLAFAQTLSGKRVLDLGTGVGKLWDYAPADVIGYALDPSHVGASKARLRHPNLTVSASVGENLPYPDDFFDVVIAADTMEHTFSPEETLAEIRRVLKPGGVFSASFPVPDSLRKWGRNQVVQGRFDPRFFFRLLYILLKRIWLFGRATFQPIDRDMNAQEWVALVESNGFVVRRIIEWPDAPQSPLVYLVHAEETS